MFNMVMFDSLQRLFDILRTLRPTRYARPALHGALTASCRKNWSMTYFLWFTRHANTSCISTRLTHRTILSVLPNYVPIVNNDNMIRAQNRMVSILFKSFKKNIIGDRTK